MRSRHSSSVHLRWWERKWIVRSQGDRPVPRAPHPSELRLADTRSGYSYHGYDGRQQPPCSHAGPPTLLCDDVVELLAYSIAHIACFSNSQRDRCTFKEPHSTDRGARAWRLII